MDGDNSPLDIGRIDSTIVGSETIVVDECQVFVVARRIRDFEEGDLSTRDCRKVCTDGVTGVLLCRCGGEHSCGSDDGRERTHYAGGKRVAARYPAQKGV